MSTPHTLALAPPPEAPSSGLNFNDILFMLYRHKVKISLFILIGIAAAALIYFFLPAPFESQSKLLVRYVVERSAIDNVAGQVAGAKGEESSPVGAPSEEVLNSEVEILTSSDLALQVAETIGPRRLLDDPSTAPLSRLLVALHLRKVDEKEELTVDDAAIALRKALDVHAITGSNIISVTYKNKDPRLAVEVLDLIVKRYLEKHLEIHRSLAGYELITREAETLRTGLDKTQDELKRVMEKYGISITIAETIKATGDELTRAEADFATAQTDLASQKANVAEIDKLSPLAGPTSEVAPLPPDSKIVNHYQGLVSEITDMRTKVTDLLGRYASGSRMVKVKQDQLDALVKQKVALEEKYPALVATVALSGSASTAGASNGLSIIEQRGRLAGLETHVAELKTRINNLGGRMRELNDIAPKLGELERQKDVQEQSYRYYAASLEKSRVDQGLNPARMPNISVVQNPSPAVRATRDLKKVVIGLAGGSVVLGLVVALFIELVLDRTVKRSRDLETRLRLPLMLTIPDFGGRLRLMDASDGEDASIETSGEFLRPFCEAIRDRLGLFFELNNLAHKPKLVAVTGLSQNAGVSTLAAGLADVLTEGGEGKVILINKPVNPKRFYSLMKEFKVSELDYVVFDMPSLGDTSATLPMAGFMDKVLLVVEAEKSGRDSVKRAYEQLSAKTDVSVIFNKSRIYGPKWLEGEL